MCKKEPTYKVGYQKIEIHSLGRLADLVSAGMRIVQGADFARLQAQKTRLGGRVINGAHGRHVKFCPECVLKNS